MRIRNWSSDVCSSDLSWSTFVSIDNPFMPQAGRDGLVAAGENSFGYAREHSEFGMRTSKIHRQYYSISTGFEGNIGSNWKWSVVGEYGKSSTTNRQLNDRIDQPRSEEHTSELQSLMRTSYA